MNQMYWFCLIVDGGGFWSDYFVFCPLGSNSINRFVCVESTWSRSSAILSNDAKRERFRDGNDDDDDDGLPMLELLEVAASKPPLLLQSAQHYHSYMLK